MKKTAISLIIGFIVLFILTIFTWLNFPTYVIIFIDKVCSGIFSKYDSATIGTFGDVFGALNTLFAGIGIVGLLGTIVVQIYLYHDDKHINKREKEDEEKDILYFMWFKIDSIIKDLDMYVSDAENIYIRYTRFEDFTEMDKQEINNNETKIKEITIDLISSFNQEKNHIIYLKNIGDNGFLKLFNTFQRLIYNTDYLIKCAKHIVQLTSKPDRVFYNSVFESLQLIKSFITDDVYTPERHMNRCNICAINEIFSKYLPLDCNMSLDVLQQLGLEVIDYLEQNSGQIDISIGQFDTLCKLKEKMNFSREELYMEHITTKNYRERIAYFSQEDYKGIKRTLDKMEKATKVQSEKYNANFQ